MKEKHRLFWSRER